jgi:hypothetical protein
VDLKFLLKPIQGAMEVVKALKNKDPKMNNHVQTIADGFNLFAWFLVVINLSSS